MVEEHRWEDDGGHVPSDVGGQPDMELDRRARVCLARHGFFMRPALGGHYWIFIPVGNDRDGSPLTRARMCWPEELRAWREGRFNAIARALAAEGHPVRVAQAPRGLWRRMVTALRRIAWRWTT